MIDETDVVTYFSANAPRENLQWTAYVVLPNGEYWGVRFSSSTEAAVVAKAVSFYNAEKAKYQVDQRIDDPWAGVINKQPKEHHFANKVWMRHKVDRTLVRVPLNEITMYEGKGYERSGPRSK